MTALAALWSSAFALAALGTWTLYWAYPGLNWGLMTLAAALVLAGGAALGGRGVPRSLIGLLAMAALLGLGAAVTADVVAHVIIALTVGMLLATATLVARAPRPPLADLWFMATLPPRFAMSVAVEVLRRLGETLMLCSSSGWRPFVRGGALAIPVVVVFALTLAGPDPLLATARDELGRFITSLDALPRAISSPCCSRHAVRGLEPVVELRPRPGRRARCPADRTGRCPPKGSGQSLLRA